MYEKYGNFNTSEDINKKAAELKEDVNQLKELAKENGIDEEIAELYNAGEIGYICDVESAAIGKLDIESAELKTTELIQDWVDYIKVLCTKDEKMAKAVRTSKKDLKSCISKLLQWSFKNAYEVDKEIVKAAGVTGTVKMGIPGMGTAKKLIREYYVGE